LFYLVATVLFNVVVSAILKLFPRYNINSLQAIVVNYCVCVVTGSVFTGNIPFNATTLNAPWLPWALLMGIAFIAIFNLTAHCTKVDGMTTTVIASKLSLVIPVVFSTLLYHEGSGIAKIMGIALAFPAVYLSTKITDKTGKALSLFWPALLFLFSGGLDTLVNYVQATFLHTRDAQAAATIICFATAGSTGVILVVVLLAMKKITFQWKNIVAGVCLGVPNFFSIYFLVLALNSNIFQSSAAIPVLNISVLVASTLAAILFFREPAGKWRMMGLALAVAAILLIGIGDR
jgi:drug/metabolite transporter (DMT)-like permease